ncbi:ABC transporter ATP-binding protein [Rhodococcus sp. (in: high G+C Gram-positive bacteria)]|uniref:ABC transporter ATP-binding protein n=1 Tax=Rhodococcus sp. TaxID=1831 RepID=UPI00257A309D|nr:ABC transporter ATP-binding protein [Rhodococcus sp. (in: high G+C Gram-positive bacteria)]MBQ7806986.1 ABC transporter ATP-binding protein [Rhodococcus sp. (in: high G+C Gram-positive bacteria)]
MARTRLGRTLPETVGVHGAIEHSAPAITFDRVNVAYGRGKTATHALVDFNLRVAPGETVALLGPSGSGKSTALKALAGFVRPTSGSVKLGTRDITNLPPAQRGIGVVVQSYALFPHMRVSENVAFGLRAHRVPRSEIGTRVAEALDMVGMSAYGKRLPRALSGGQQQRIAIARALAIRPGVLLLDEPLAALDAQLRESMLGELARLRAALPDTAMLYVTHDQSEALALADRIAVMRNARLADIDTAESLWKRPPSSFTAAFLGGANLLPCTVTRVIGTSALVSIGGTPFTAHAPQPEIGHIEWESDMDAYLCVRPHAVAVTGVGARGSFPARIVSSVWRGSTTRLTLAVRGLDDVRVDADVPGHDERPVDTEVGVVLPTDGSVLVPADRHP